MGNIIDFYGNGDLRAGSRVLRCFLTFFLLIVSTGPAAAGSMTENAWGQYDALKAAIEADAEKDRTDPFDEDIDRFRESLGPGFSFGNEMDWSYKNQKIRKYSLRFALCSGEKELFSAEVPFSLTGELKTSEGSPEPGPNYFRLKLRQNEETAVTSDMPVDAFRIILFNPMASAAGTEVSIDIRYLRLTDKFGFEIFNDEAVLKEYPARVSAEGEPVVSFPLRRTAGNFMGEEAEIRADIRLDGFVSDYPDDPTLIFRETYTGEPATDRELAFLKAQGFRSIRLPVTWAPHMDSTGTIDAGWFEEVNKVVDRTLGYGFTVIVDIHHDAGKSGWITADPDAFAHVEGLYRYLVLQIAENFKHYGINLVLEGPNEITKPSWIKGPAYVGNPGERMDTMNRINQIFVDEVRRTGYGNKDRFLMVSPWYAHRGNLADYVLPQDPAEDRILTSIHDYNTDGDGILKALSWLRESGREYLELYHPVMGEFGILRDTELNDKVTFMERNMALAKELGIPMILWDDGGNYALMKNRAAEWDKDYGSDRTAEAMMGE